jgi:SAM-dependent methyltransferase
MDEMLKTKLTSLPALTRPKRVLVCKICGGGAELFDVVDFLKFCSADPYSFGTAGIPVEYYRCTLCSFTFTDLIDDWTSDEVAKFIYNEEYIKVDPEYTGNRAERDADFFISILGDYRDQTVLDYGSGTGVLAKRMREVGFDAEAYDPFSSPHRPTRRFDIITCMEVLEHSSDPVSTLNDMVALLEEGGCILLATGIQPDNFDDMRANWWYAAPRNGHVSLHSIFSLVAMARGAGLTSYPSDRFCGFARAPSPSISAFLAAMGQPLQSVVLLAPGEGTPQPDLRQRASHWHSLEDGRFRWTATNEVTWEWHPEAVAGDVVLRLPTTLEIEPGFLERSRLIVDGRPAECKVTHGTLTARATLSGNTPVLIRLKTPPPPTAHDANGCDDFRHLGLAVLAEPG